jgi:hypothetical protein
MRIRLLGVAMAAACLLLAAASQASTPVSYRVDQKTFKKQTLATSALTFTMYSDEACSVMTAEETLFGGDVTIVVDAPKTLKIKGGVKPAKAAVIQATLSDMPDGPIYLEVSGPGINPLGPRCQVQAAGGSSGGGVAGPSGPTGPAGTPGGPSGPAGPTGGAGPAGPSGPAGAAGSAGPAGPTGPPGSAGAAGPPGPAGPSGPSGPLGLTGAAGPSGPSGPSGPTGLTGSAGPSGPSGPAGAGTNLWAVINSNGTLNRGSGVVSSANLGGATGAYEVIFNRNVSACAYVATVFRVFLQAGGISTDLRGGNNNGVFVETTDGVGALADRPFHLAVFCP